MKWTHEISKDTRTEPKKLEEEDPFPETVIKDLNTNLAKVWTGFEKAKRQLKLILEEQQTIRRGMRNLQKKQKNLVNDIDYLYEKEEKLKISTPNNTRQ
ncbi:hypothetical protein O181_081142 [Austropuccinia psidii MF-1]|uniref:Uncharacterized protein n=1 Tax=Austropuccinia psidii MF-1 TaxID=1389203 RepID=A0A9Q3FQ61_9BASI|nr:hypothetical protein [Austropuccinia psidii MF-1]